jgi:flagellar protein FliL
MAEENGEEEVKKGKPIVKIILIVVGVLLLLGIAVGGTLFATGFFDPKPEAAVQAKLEQMQAEAAPKTDEKGNALGPDGKPIEPQLVTKQTPEAVKFEYSYKEIERDLVANLTGSRKVMQIKIAFMTRYDERVLKNVEKHEFAIRSVALDVMRQVVDSELDKPDFRKVLAERIRDAVNEKLMSLEDFGGIEEVYFTSFVVQ